MLKSKRHWGQMGNNITVMNNTCTIFKIIIFDEYIIRKNNEKVPKFIESNQFANFGFPTLGLPENNKLY